MSRVEKVIIEKFSYLNFKEIIVQFGFQSYPTETKDLAINKLLEIKKFFPNYKYSFADHVDSLDDFSVNLPSILSALGIDYIEKHTFFPRNKLK